MNIFVLDTCPEKAARCLCDKHVVKMILESAQILCTVSWKCGVGAPYRAAHRNHPVVLWVYASLSNYEWLVKHALEMCKEYEFRYCRIHKSKEIIWWCKGNGGKPEDIGLTPFVQCMPDQYKGDNAVDAYRKYYQNEKQHIANWKVVSKVPDWWNTKCLLKKERDCLQTL